MGREVVDKKNTQIYYPSDWLVEGGPTFESANCPKFQEDEDVEPLQIIYNKTTKYFGVTQGEFIVMESKDRQDVAEYVKDYIEGFQNWVAEYDGIDEMDNLQ
jgi:hypothetical protein